MYIYIYSCINTYYHNLFIYYLVIANGDDELGSQHSVSTQLETCKNTSTKLLKHVLCKKFLNNSDNN